MIRDLPRLVRCSTSLPARQLDAVSPGRSTAETVLTEAPLTDLMPFSYEDFREWFDDYTDRFLEPARESAYKALTSHLRSELTEMEISRIKVSPGRVKGRERTWRKLELPKYKARIDSLETIPSILDDLVGLRITCNNRSDVQRVMDIVRDLDVYAEGMEPVLCQEQGSYRDYLEKPKASGYRAVHINLLTSVPAGLKRKVITCELQVRTLLQDGWGELTHEDTYKPGSATPPLVGLLSRRMADLLAAVDDIAQDIRDELDRLSGQNIENAAVVHKPSGIASIDSVAPRIMPLEPALETAVVRYLADRVGDLEHPIDLASLAWELAREFGQEISNGWFGKGSFKDFLTQSVPDARVINQPPSFLLPKDFDGTALLRNIEAHRGLPTTAFLFKQVDGGFPLLSHESLAAAYERLAAASQVVDWSDPETTVIGRLNEMTLRARDMNDEEHSISRAHLDYIAKSLLFSRKLDGPLSEEQVRSVFRESSIKRIGDIVKLSKSQKLALKKWLG